MKKRIIITLLALTLVFSALSGCGKKVDDTQIATPAVGTVSPTPSVVPDASTPTPESESTKAPATESAKPPQVTQKPNTPVPTPTATPTPVPALSASELMNKMVDALPETKSLSEMPLELYEDLYGINPALFEEVLVYGPLMNVRANEIIIIKAKDSAGVNEAKNLLKARLANLDEQWKRYLPDQYELVQAGQIVTKGLYVTMVVADGVDKAVSAFNSSL